MNSTLGTLVVRCILICTPGLVCQCSSPDAGAPVAAQTAKPVLFREDTLVARVKKLERGDSMERCVSLLGEPTSRQELLPKTGSPLLGTAFCYVVKQEGVRLNTATDRFLKVYFDETGRMETASWHGEP